MEVNSIILFIRGRMTGCGL